MLSFSARLHESSRCTTKNHAYHGFQTPAFVVAMLSEKRAPGGQIHRDSAGPVMLKAKYGLFMSKASSQQGCDQTTSPLRRARTA